jgi:hypothetical protein
MVKVNAQSELFPKVSPHTPDSKLAGLGVHTLLLSLHSPLLKNIFETLSETSEIVVIVPDVEKTELKSLLRVMYGIEEVAFVSGSTLEALGLDSFKSFVVFEDFEDLVNEVTIDVETAPVPTDKFENNSIINVVSSENTPPIELSGNPKDTSEKNLANDTPTEVTKFACNICDKTFKTSKYRIWQ